MLHNRNIEVTDESKSNGRGDIELGVRQEDEVLTPRRIVRYATSSASSNSEKRGHHLNIQRANAATQILSNTLANISPVVGIPGKFAQFVLSGQAIFRPDLTKLEISAHVFQSLLSLSQLILFISMYFKEEDCAIAGTFACKILTVLDAFYQGTLLVGWVPAEISQSGQSTIQNTEVTL